MKRNNSTIVGEGARPVALRNYGGLGRLMAVVWDMEERELEALIALAQTVKGVAAARKDESG